MSINARDRDPGWRKLLIRIGLICAAVTVLAFLSGATNGRSPDLRMLLVVLAVQPLNAAALGLVGWRLSILSRGSVSAWSGVKAAALSGTMLYVVPSRLGEFVKPVYLSAHCGTPLLKSIALMAVERFLDILVVTLTLLVALALLSGSASSNALYLWGGLSLLGAGGCVLLILNPALLDRVVALIPGRRLRNFAAGLLAEVRLTVAPHLLAAGLLMGIAIWLLSFGLFYVLLLGSSVPLDLRAVLWVFLAGTLGLAIGIAPGGLGTFEAGIVVALKYYGIGTAEALNLALLIRLANLGVVPLIAIWALAADRIGLAELVSAARALRAKRENL